MSYISAVVNSFHLFNADEDFKASKIKGEFQWDLPIPIPALMNNYWGVKVKQAVIANKIISNYPADHYGMTVYNHSPSDPVIADISKHINFAHSPLEVVNTINDLIDDKFPVSFSLEDSTVSMKVGSGMYIALGKRLAEAFGLIHACKSHNPNSCVYSGGEYYGDCFDFVNIYNGQPDVVHIALDIVRPTIFGNTFKPVVCTVPKPGMVSIENEPEIYHDLIQSPVTSVTISFLDQSGKIIDFFPQSPNDFLFSIQFEFKKLVMFD